MINYAILVGNEYKELYTLLTYLSKHIDTSLIKVLVDTNKQTGKIDNLLEQYKIDTYYNYLQNFASHRNYLLYKCDQPYVFWIDADEIPALPLLQNLPQILGSNPEVDILRVPRVNFLINDTESEIPLDIGPPPAEDGRIGWPDYQGRIHKRLPNILWKGDIHEQLEGSSKIGFLPANYSLSFVHIKMVSEQIKRKQFYDTLKC